MTDHTWNDDVADESDPMNGQLAALLANPALWSEPTATDEDAIVAAIRAEAAAAGPVMVAGVGPEGDASTGADWSRPDAGGDGTASNVVPISRARRWLTPVLSAAAGVAIALIGVAAVANLDDSPAEGPDGVELALAGTDLAPDATAAATVIVTPVGTRIDLDVTGLPPAPPGTYYEAWLRQDAEVGVSAGTFHLRGGDGAIELWAGVSPDDYPLLTVTIQDEADPASSGRVVLRGQVGDG